MALVKISGYRDGVPSAAEEEALRDGTHPLAAPSLGLLRHLAALRRPGAPALPGSLFSPRCLTHSLLLTASAMGLVDKLRSKVSGSSAEAPSGSAAAQASSGGVSTPLWAFQGWMGRGRAQGPAGGVAPHCHQRRLPESDAQAAAAPLPRRRPRCRRPQARRARRPWQRASPASRCALPPPPRCVPPVGSAPWLGVGVLVAPLPQRLGSACQPLYVNYAHPPPHTRPILYHNVDRVR